MQLKCNLLICGWETCRSDPVQAKRASLYLLDTTRRVFLSYLGGRPYLVGRPHAVSQGLKLNWGWHLRSACHAGSAPFSPLSPAGQQAHPHACAGTGQRQRCVMAHHCLLIVPFSLIDTLMPFPPVSPLYQVMSSSWTTEKSNSSREVCQSIPFSVPLTRDRMGTLTMKLTISVEINETKKMLYRKAPVSSIEDPFGGGEACRHRECLYTINWSLPACPLPFTLPLLFSIRNDSSGVFA